MGMIWTWLTPAMVIFMLAGCSAKPVLFPPPPPIEIDGMVEQWGVDGQNVTSTLTVSSQKAGSREYVLMQLRVGMDTYRFTLSDPQLELLIDALNNYQSIVKQPAISRSDEAGWLYKTLIKLQRLGAEAREDHLIVNIERQDYRTPVLTLSFDSWLASASGAYSRDDRIYRKVIYIQSDVTLLRTALEEIYRGKQ